MAKYSKVSRRIHGDAKYRALSKATPNGQTLFMRLLTAPEHTCIPGVIVARIGGLADDLGWSTEDLRRIFRELTELGIGSIDESAGLIFMPNAWKHNAPESINVIKAWARVWRELPDSPLKLPILKTLQDLTEGLPQSFRMAFAKTMPKDCEKLPYAGSLSGAGAGAGSLSGIGTVESHETAYELVAGTPVELESVEEEEPFPTSDDDTGASSAIVVVEEPKPARAMTLVGLWVDLLRGIRKVSKPTVSAKDAAIASKWAKGREWSEIAIAVTALVRDDSKFVVENGWALWLLPRNANAYLAGNKTNGAPSLREIWANQASGVVDTEKLMKG